MNSLRFTAAIVLACLVSLAWGQDVHAPLPNPPAFNSGISQEVIVTTKVSHPGVIPTGVNLQRINVLGQVEAVLAILKDDGLDSDLAAGDGLFTGRVKFMELQPGNVKIRTSVAVKGRLQRLNSMVSQLIVLPPGVPADISAPDMTRNEVDPVNGVRYVNDRVNVCFRAEAPVQTVQQVAASLGASIVGSMLGIGNCWQFSLGPTSTLSRVKAFIAALKGRADVIAAEGEQLRGIANVVCDLPTCSDASFSRLKLFDAHNFASGKGKIIAVVDTGVDANHTALNPGKLRVISGPDFTVNPSLTHTVDTHGHGTHVAGIAAATAPEAKILALKVCDFASGLSEPCPISASYRALEEAFRRGAHVINMSLAGPARDDIEEYAINNLRQNGVIVVAAAGNFNSTTPSWPAYYPGVLSVGNVNTSDRRYDAPADGSNYGTAGNRWVHVAAPGVNVTSTLPGSNSGQMTGTSQSAPFVSGLLALMMDSDGLNPMSAAGGDSLVKRIKQSAIPIPAVAGQDKCPDDPCNQGLGDGRISPLAALGVMRITRSTAINAGAVQTIEIRITSGNALLYSSTVTTGGQRTGCAISATPCIVDVPFDFSKLPRGTYRLTFRTLEAVGSYFSAVQVFYPGSTLAAVSGSVSVDTSDPTKGFFSLFAHSTRFATFDVTTGRLTLP